MFRFQSSRLKTKEKIGKGRFGTVFPYQKDPQDLKWVVKRIKAEDIDAVLTSLPEIVLGFSCDHPRIVPVKGYFIEKESNGESFNIYMKLPRMKVTLLDEFKERKRKNNSYSEEEIIRHFYSLVCGVEYLHSKRIYHGDIKHDNLLLDSSGTLKIADIGIAKHVEEGDEYQTVTEKIGTYQYTAPEILGAERKDIKKEALAKADIWGLGVVVLELCVFDFRLLNSLDREETRKKIEKHLESLEGKFQNGLIALVKRILNFDPKERPDIGHIKDELERNFSKILEEDLLILRKGPADNGSEDEVQALKQKLKENLENFEAEKKQLKEIISQFESNLSQQKQQYEQRIQVLISQNNSKARQEPSLQEAENRLLKERIRGLEQGLQQQKNKHLDNLNILKDKENKLNDYEQKMRALQQREQVAVERLEQEKRQLQRTISQLEQNISQQAQQSEEKLKALLEENNMKALKEKRVLEQTLQENMKGMERELQKVRDESQRYLQELNLKNEKLTGLQRQIQSSQQEKETYKQKNQYLEQEMNYAKSQMRDLENKIQGLQTHHSTEKTYFISQNDYLQKIDDMHQLEKNKLESNSFSNESYKDGGLSGSGEMKLGVKEEMKKEEEESLRQALSEYFDQLTDEVDEKIATSSSQQKK